MQVLKHFPQSLEGRFDLNHIPSWHGFPFTRTHTPQAFKREVTLTKNTSKIHVEDDYKNPQPDKETPPAENTGSSGSNPWEEFPVYLADSRVNVSYVSRDMCISYPVPLQLRNSPHRPTNTD